jgi:hypothetical protein
MSEDFTVFQVADGATPRARTAEEVRAGFLNTCRDLADYWAEPRITHDGGAAYTCHERLSGFLHSVLCVFDGVNGGMPAFDIVASPHPDDKEFHRSEGDDWIEPGTVINDCMMHELLYREDLPGVWHKHGRAEGEPR